MFRNLLDHPNITIVLDTDAKEILKFQEDEILLHGEPFQGEVIYTGAVDELFDCCDGRLPYRSLRFCILNIMIGTPIRDRSVVNYTVSEDFTRITEFKYLTRQKDTDGTTIVKEYPFAYTGNRWRNSLLCNFK